MLKIAIASGKGGTGKTFVSTNLYEVMKQSGFHVTLIDCDAEVPNSSVFVQGKLLSVHPTQVACPQIDADKCTLCGRCAESCHFNAITCIPAARYIKIVPDLCHGCNACLYLCPSGAVGPAQKTIGQVSAYGNDTPCLIEARIQEGEHSPVPVIRDAIRLGETTSSDFLILDAPPGCSCPFVNTVMDADRVLLVTEPTPFGLSDLQHTVKVLRELGKQFQVIINRADLGDDSMRRYLEREQIELLAEIPYSADIASIYSQGKLAARENSEMHQLFTNLLKQITNHENSRR